MKENLKKGVNIIINAYLEGNKLIVLCDKHYILHKICLFDKLDMSMVTKLAGAFADEFDKDRYMLIKD